jgi:hypothetical protein
VPGRSPQASGCEPYREWIEDGVRRGRPAMAIWQDLVDDHGFALGYASVKRFVAKRRAEASPREAHPVIETAPGEEAQVDYGDGPMEHRRFRVGSGSTSGYGRYGKFPRGPWTPGRRCLRPDPRIVLGALAHWQCRRQE